ncbi:hypothetical protein [Streptomyces sp. TRM70350]|uniref:hypothetical protein n=1 Tax=Streptomyces sp. TRM70350 TaxID=2856165 RepID=UPI001C481031|nr:hypothetical protein [Streptomyces sp. TRM70350]MBV7699925.1 hypothetical protein [Streptomyces sp. TRM70350]
MANTVGEYGPDSGMYADFVHQGFKPGAHVIYKFHPCISVDDLKAAQYDSTYHDRKRLVFAIGSAGGVALVVDSVTAMFVDDEPDYDHPNWRVECAVVDSDFDGLPSSSKVNLYFVSVYGSSLDDGYIQLIADPDPDPNAAFRYTEEP